MTLSQFISSMPLEMQADVASVQALGLVLLPTGSRAICPGSAREDSDWDLYSFWSHDSDLIDRLERIGFEYETKNYGGQDSICFSKGLLSIVLFYTNHKFELFHRATEFCIGMGGPTDRAVRVRVFQEFHKFCEPDYIP
jgi:hypothetical protein